MIKYLSLITFIALLQIPLLAKAESVLCPDINDFRCLVKQSFSVYRENHNNWWDMYAAAKKKAFSCSSVEDTATFLSLWSGETDGEMREGLTENTETLIKVNAMCFLDGFIALDLNVQISLLNTYCPFSNIEPLNKAMMQYRDNDKYKNAIKKIIARHNECKAMIN